MTFSFMDQALRWHASTINIKSTAIPPEWKKAFDEFQKKIGYRFVLRRLEYPQSVKVWTYDAVEQLVVQCRSFTGLLRVRSRV